MYNILGGLTLAAVLLVIAYCGCQKRKSPISIWQFQSKNWGQLNIHCNRKDLERISMDITANLATSRYYLCVKLQLHCMEQCAMFV